MAFYMDLTVVRSQDVQLVIDLVRANYLGTELIPLSELGIDTEASAIVYEPQAGWIALTAGLGSGFQIGPELSRRLQTDAMAVMCGNAHAVGFGIWRAGSELTRLIETDDACYELGEDDLAEHYSAFRAIVDSSVSDDRLRDVLSGLDMVEAESIGELLSLLGLPKALGHGPPEDVENSAAYGLPAIAALIDEGDGDFGSNGEDNDKGDGDFASNGEDAGDIIRGPW